MSPCEIDCWGPRFVEMPASPVDGPAGGGSERYTQADDSAVRVLLQAKPAIPTPRPRRSRSFHALRRARWLVRQACVPDAARLPLGWDHLVRYVVYQVQRNCPRRTARALV